MSEINSPAIRFAGFTDAWEQREFAELVSRVSTMSDRKYDMPRVEYEDIISGQGQLNKNIYEKQSNKRGIHFEPGDILFGKLRPYLQNWLAPDFTGIAVGDWWVLKPQGVNTEFICALLQSPQYQRVSNLSTGTKMPRSDWSVVARTTFAVPSQICEQAQIGKTFTNIDRLITLHQREHDKTVNIKKALLEKMFPKDGEDKPEIRFAGFTGAWEQRKLGNLVEFFSGLTYSPHNVVSDGTLVLRSSNVKEGAIINADNVFVEAECVNVSNVQVGDIVVVVRNGSRNLIGKHALIKRSMPNTVIGAFMTGLRCHIPEFTNALLDTHHFDNEIKKNLGATINQITTGEFKKMTFFVPEQSEQKKIGRIFTLLDNLIAQHQRELTKLQNIKKALLEKMFV